MTIRRWWTYEHSTVWARDLEPRLAAISPRVEATFGEADVGCAPQVAEAMGLSAPGPVLERLRAGKRCFIACVGGEIAAYGWVSRCEQIGELERSIRLPPAEAYIWDCATQRPYRGLRLYSALLSSIATVLRDEGLRRAWIAASVSNGASLRGIANSGFTPVLSLRYVRLFRLRGLIFSACPDATAPLVAAARRALGDAEDFHCGPLAFSRQRPQYFIRAGLVRCDQLDGDA